MYKNILVPTDGSDFSEKAVQEAAVLARAIGAKIVLFHVVAPHRVAVYADGVSFPEPSHDELVKEAEAKANTVLSHAAKKADGVAVETKYAVSFTPYEAIIEAATRGKCDLIVMASHGRRGLSELLLGSETHKVLTHSALPVLVVH